MYDSSAKCYGNRKFIVHLLPHLRYDANGAQTDGRCGNRYKVEIFNAHFHGIPPQRVHLLPAPALKRG